MIGNYEANLNRLRQEIQADGARPDVVDAAIIELFESSNESLPRDLLLLLSDNAEYDESMFSIIHAAETSNDEEYIRAVLGAFTDIMRSAPRWTSIVLMRVLNSRSAQLEMIRQLRNAPASTKASVREMCERINAVSLEFLSKTTPVTLASK
ncbi:Imm30 family immunity protein [Rhizobium multihospitium]|uniref:Imm30 family immunity protein n=1 Tax=Rhizobium multihospitium TaxID=410764 RepID=UPI000B80F0B0|nr:Imm30 family immunity protein [Rhizobium multihospitium]